MESEAPLPIGDSQLHFERTRTSKMLRVIRFLVRWQIWSDRRGQDIIEYALLAALVTVSAVAVVPGVSSSINIVFSKVNSVMILAASS